MFSDRYFQRPPRGSTDLEFAVHTKQPAPDFQIRPSTTPANSGSPRHCEGFNFCGAGAITGRERGNGAMLAVNWFKWLHSPITTFGTQKQKNVGLVASEDEEAGRYCSILADRSQGFFSCSFNIQSIFKYICTHVRLFRFEYG